MRRWILGLSLLTALVVFCVVQDRVTAAGARSYVARQRQGAVDSVAAVMEPAIRDSVRRGLAWSGAWSGGVLLAGLAAAGLTGARRRAAAGSAAARRG